MEKSEKARIRSAAHHQHQRFHVVQANHQEHLSPAEIKEIRAKEMRVKYLIVGISIVTAIALGYLAVNFGQ
jgi:hypothetical protein